MEAIPFNRKYFNRLLNRVKRLQAKRNSDLLNLKIDRLRWKILANDYTFEDVNMLNKLLYELKGKYPMLQRANKELSDYIKLHNL